MTFKDDMAADLAAVMINTSDFAEAVTYTPNGTAVGVPTTFALDAVPGDIEPAFLATTSGEAEQRLAQFVAVRTAVRAGILTIEGTVRDPRRGDRLTVAAGGYAGTWTIERMWADLGGAVVLFGRFEVHNQFSGDGMIARGG